MRIYELVLVLRPNLSEPNRKKVLDTIKDLLKSLKITEEQDWGSKALAYPIKKELTGHYFDLILETETSIPNDFEKRLLTNDTILRHLVIRKK